MAHNTRKSVRTRLLSSADSRVCTICLSGIGETATPSKSSRKRKVAILPSCQHMFCEDCILEWSKQTNTCPIDRIKFNLIELWSLRSKNIVNEIRVEDVLDSSLLVQVNDDLTYCEVCGRCDREDVLLLCDGCNKGYHIDCLRPQLDFIPLDVWFCEDCTPNVGRAFRWRLSHTSRRLHSSSRENTYENPHLPQFTEITQEASENSSGSEDPGNIRRSRKRYISPSPPSNSSDGDSEGDTQTLSVSIQRPSLTQPVRKPRKRIRMRYHSNRSDDKSDASLSSDIYRVHTPKRFCRRRRSIRKRTMRKRYQVVARPFRHSKLKARENTRKLFRRSNSLITSPSSSTNTELINSEQPLTTQDVYTSSDQTDSDTSIIQRKSSLSEEIGAIPDTDPVASDNATNSDSDETIPDTKFVPVKDPTMPEAESATSETDSSVNEQDSSDQDYDIHDDMQDNKINNDNNKKQPHLSDQPCSSHSDNSNSRKKSSSRSLRLRQRPVYGKKVRTSTVSNSKHPRKMAPRRAKVQAEQILLLQEFFESDDVSD